MTRNAGWTQNSIAKWLDLLLPPLLLLRGGRTREEAKANCVRATLSPGRWTMSVAIAATPSAVGSTATGRTSGVRRWAEECAEECIGPGRLSLRPRTAEAASESVGRPGRRFQRSGEQSWEASVAVCATTGLFSAAVAAVVAVVAVVAVAAVVVAAAVAAAVVAEGGGQRCVDWTRTKTVAKGRRAMCIISTAWRRRARRPSTNCLAFQATTDTARKRKKQEKKTEKKTNRSMRGWSWRKKSDPKVTSDWTLPVPWARM